MSGFFATVVSATTASAAANFVEPDSTGVLKRWRNVLAINDGSSDVWVKLSTAGSTDPSSGLTASTSVDGTHKLGNGESLAVTAPDNAGFTAYAFIVASGSTETTATVRLVATG